MRPLLASAAVWCTSFRKVSSMGLMRAAQFTPGGPENLSLGQAEIPTLREKRVLLKVLASAVNRADTLQRKGLYPPPAGESSILGLEAVGTVEEVHESCTSGLKKGDRVMTLLPGGGNADYVTVREEHTMVVPEQLSTTEAAAIPETWLTAFQLLTHVGSFERGHRVLVHAGASGVGTAAIQLVKLLGGSSIVTAGSQDKIDFCKSLGALGGANYKEGPFGETVKALTDGAGVDMILDCVGGSHWEQNLDCIAQEGQWVLYGLMGGAKVDSDILAKILRKRVTLVGSTLRTRSDSYKEKLISSFKDTVLSHFGPGTVKPIIYTVLPLSKISEAHKLMESNVTTGKIVLDHTVEHS